MIQARPAIPALFLGLLALVLGSTDGAGMSRSQPAVYTLTGTTVTKDGLDPVPGVRVTVMPESTVAISDLDGDFLVSWAGREGWITFIPTERALEGKEWCKRRVLQAASDTTRGPRIDLGPIRITPRIPLNYLQMPSLPRTHSRPAMIRVPGPKPGEKDTCRVRVSYAVDLWGRVTRVGLDGGDTPPPALQEAIFAWVRGVPWIVSPETACGANEPFRALDPMDYVWTDSVWVKIPTIDPVIRDRMIKYGIPGR